MDAIGPDLFVARILLDVNFDKQGFIVAEAGAQVVGFIYAAVAGSPRHGDEGQAREGWASVFFVHPRWRRRGIGTALIRAAMAYVRARGCSVLAISPYAPGYFWPGPDRERHAGAIALLEKLGFTTREEPVAMDASLVGFTVPQDVLELGQRRAAEGYTVGSLQTRYIADLLEFLSAHFSPDWQRAVRDALSRGSPTSRCCWLAVAQRSWASASPVATITSLNASAHLAFTRIGVAWAWGSCCSTSA